MFISILYVFRALSAHHQENLLINALSGICHSVLITVWYVGWVGI
jgi:hypothetical protein